MQSGTSRMGHRWLLGMTAAITLAVCSCATDPEINPGPPAPSGGLAGTVVTNDPALPNDPITIDSARVVGDTLVAAVSHGGGCTEHTYQLVIGTAWMESFPVQVRARIAHNAKGDPCRALLRKELRMALRPLKGAYRASYKQEHGTVAIQLAGATKTLLYMF
ncbi:MAG: hypothetical protein H7Z40_24030 [Phycisphaerae bacterium]|nr:hypothetical protein [Gemmatimonadaceae bacterium]